LNFKGMHIKFSRTTHMHDRPHSFVFNYSCGKRACEHRDYMTFFCLPQKSSMTNTKYISWCYKIHIQKIRLLVHIRYTETLKRNETMPSRIHKQRDERQIVHRPANRLNFAGYPQ
jgi:hypothetical protein